MKKLWLHSVRGYLRLGMFFYFKRIHVYNVENIPKDKPVLLLANHQNALLDALLIATKCRRFSYFLTRAAVFKKPFVSRILKSLQMLPVYRVRDGWSNITNNNTIFESCSEILNNKEAIVIFPEGSHNLARRVRPLSKGFTRIVFDTLEKYPDLDLQLVPIGLNFVNAKECPDSAAMYFGKSFAAKDFIKDNKNEGVVKLKEAVHNKIKSLTTHIPQENYVEDLQKLSNLNVDFLIPQEVNTCLESDFNSCISKSRSKTQFLGKFFQLLLKLNLILPYLIWKFVAQPKITEIEFTSTFRFALAITLVPFYLLVITLVLSSIFSFFVGPIYLMISLTITLLAIKF